MWKTAGTTLTTTNTQSGSRNHTGTTGTTHKTKGTAVPTYNQRSIREPPPPPKGWWFPRPENTPCVNVTNNMHNTNYKKPHPAYRGKWQGVRRAILERDNHTCQIGLTGCKGTANTVDHITPLAMGGAWWDHDNLRAACSFCNGVLATATQKHLRETPTTHTNATASRMW